MAYDECILTDTGKHNSADATPRLKVNSGSPITFKIESVNWAEGKSTDNQPALAATQSTDSTYTAMSFRNTQAVSLSPNTIKLGIIIDFTLTPSHLGYLMQMVRSESVFKFYQNLFTESDPYSLGSAGSKYVCVRVIGLQLKATSQSIRNYSTYGKQVSGYVLRCDVTLERTVDF